jgi:hypothetical protein
VNPRYHGRVFARAKASLTVLLLFLFAAAFAPKPAQACTLPNRDARVRVSFLADSDLAAMVKWAKEQTCTDYTFGESLSERRLAQGVILSVVGHDVGAIFEILLHTMNLGLKGTGAKRTIVATGPESSQSKAARDREKVDSERARIFDNIEAEISKQDESHFTITRKGLDVALGSFSAISRSMRLVPETKNGKPIGFRVFALKPGSLLACVGFQNGDLVRALNGSDISTPDKALEAYAKLRSLGLVRVSLLRQGKPVDIEMKIE